MWKLKLTTLVILAVCCCAAESASWSDRAPLITQYGCEGLPLSLTCRKRPPGRIIGWFKITDTNELSLITPDHRMKIDVKGTLQFSSVNVKDTAVYKCSVSGISTLMLGSQVNLKVIKVGTSFCDDEITKTVTQSNPFRPIKTMSEKDLSAASAGGPSSVLVATSVIVLALISTVACNMIWRLKKQKTDNRTSTCQYDDGEVYVG